MYSGRSYAGEEKQSSLCPAVAWTEEAFNPGILRVRQRPLCLPLSWCATTQADANPEQPVSVLPGRQRASQKYLLISPHFSQASQKKPSAENLAYRYALRFQLTASQVRDLAGYLPFTSG